MAAGSGRALAGVALLSAGGLLLEIALTRLLSAVYLYTYVYAVLSLAILGIGLGAALAAWQPSLRAPARLPLYAGLAGGGAAGQAVLVSLGGGFDLRPLLLSSLALPYLFLGLALATLFGARSRESGALYAADLAGAGAGALLALPLLNALGGLDGVLTAALLLALPAALLGRRLSPSAVAAPLLTAALLVGNLAGDWLQFDLAGSAIAKPVQLRLTAGAVLEESRWDAYARTDLVRDPISGARYLFIDGGAGSLIPDAAHQNLWQGDIGRLPFVLFRPESALVIGPGGGLDIALARAAGTPSITAVEINPHSVALVQELGPVIGPLYDAEGVTTHIDEGRSYLKRSRDGFDLIFLSQVIAQAAERSGYALSENDLYTVEAFEDYLAHLDPDGWIAVKLYDELTLTRALTTAITALGIRGLSEAEAARHTAAFLDPTGRPPIPLLLIGNRPLTPGRAAELVTTAADLELVPLFVPEAVANPPLDGLLAGRTDVAAIVANAANAEGVAIDPTTDARPFFFQFESGLPRNLRAPLIGVGLSLLVTVLVLVVSQRALAHPGLRWSPLLFAALGAGFMLIEISLLRSVRLFLGHPTVTLSLVLGVLLVGGGLGSALAGRTRPGREPVVIAVAAVAVCLLLLLRALAWPPVATVVGGAGSAARALTAALGLLPLALVMGMPFPLGLRFVGRFGARPVALGWAVNGIFSVAGAMLATTLALTAGFGAVTLAGYGAYLVALGYGWRSAIRPGTTD